MTLGGSGTLGLYKYNYPSKRTKTLEDDSVVGVVGQIGNSNLYFKILTLDGVH